MLIDAFGRTIDYLRISVTDKCDLRCTYCIPKRFKDFEVPKNYLTFSEIERVVAAFARLGTHHFRLTGGEPLLRKDLPILIKNLSALSGVEDLSLTTNGTQLTKYAQALKDSGLNRLNVSLDSLRKECVTTITGSNNLESVLAGLLHAKAVGFHKIKINMVPLAGINQDDIASMIAFCMQHDFVLRLIELMPMGANAQKLKHVDLRVLINTLSAELNLRVSHKIIGSGPAQYFENEEGTFSLGLITPMSQHFCETCNRVRLSVDGVLYMCLGQAHQFNLRKLLRAGCTDLELEDAIKYAVTLKPKAHDFLSDPTKITRLMSMTGG